MSGVRNKVSLYWLGKIRLALLLVFSLGSACSEQAPVDGKVPSAGAPSSAGSPGAGAFPASSGGSGAINAAGQANQRGGRNAAGGAGGSGAAGASNTGGSPDGSSGEASTGGAGANSGFGGSGGASGALSGTGGGAVEGGRGGADAVAGAGGGAAGSGGVGGSGTRWVGTWSAAPQLTEPENLPPAPGLSNNSLRQIFYVSIGGSRLRLHLSNQYGNAPLVISGAHLARSMSGHTIDAATGRALAFSGSPAVTIPVGGSVSSDEFEFMLPAQTKVALTLAFGATPSDVTGHPGSRTTSYIATGNAVSAVSFASPVSTTHWYYATGIDVVAPAPSAAVLTFGDSITDGRGSTVDGNDRWPDNLSRRLRSNAATTAIAVMNQAIGGNAVLGEGNGPMAVTRFERDVLNQPGVRWVIILHGVNDVGTSTSATVAAELTAAYEQFVATARARGIRAYGVPILPFAGSQYDTPAHEAIRQEVNTWIRADGHFDAVIDLDAAVRDPATPARLRPEYDSGDGLHLTPAGYQKMADAIDLALFTE
jgi:lysophospholipase L1-like esterase